MKKILTVAVVMAGLLVVSGGVEAAGRAAEVDAQLMAQGLPAGSYLVAQDQSQGAAAGKVATKASKKKAKKGKKKHADAKAATVH